MSKFTICEQAATSICKCLEDQNLRLGEISVLLDAAYDEIENIREDEERTVKRPLTGYVARDKVYTLLSLVSIMIEERAADIDGAHSDMLRQIKLGQTVAS